MSSCQFHGDQYIERLGNSDLSAYACLICFTATLEGDEPSMLEKTRVEEIFEQIRDQEQL